MVVAEDEVDLGRSQQPPSQLPLGRGRGGPVLLAPVQQHDHELGAGLVLAGLRRRRCGGVRSC